MRIITLVLLFVLTAPAAWAAGFFQSIDDLPLMSDLREDVGKALVFDKPDGRIVKLVARGKISKKAVREFYRRTLPQLGWQPVLRSYVREGEVLTLEYEQENDELVVYVSIKPQ